MRNFRRQRTILGSVTATFSLGCSPGLQRDTDGATGWPGPHMAVYKDTKLSAAADSDDLVVSLGVG